MRAALWPILAMAALPALAAGTENRASAEAAAPMDPQAVLADLYARTLAADSSAALILFIARYPDDPLAGEARLRLRARPPDPAPAEGPDGMSDGLNDGANPDGAIIAQFDAARIAGPAALDAFALRHAGHPLAAEALRPFWRSPAP